MEAWRSWLLAPGTQGLEGGFSDRRFRFRLLLMTRSPGNSKTQRFLYSGLSAMEERVTAMADAGAVSTGQAQVRGVQWCLYSDPYGLTIVVFCCFLPMGACSALMEACAGPSSRNSGGCYVLSFFLKGTFFTLVVVLARWWFPLLS